MKTPGHIDNPVRLIYLYIRVGLTRFNNNPEWFFTVQTRNDERAVQVLYGRRASLRGPRSGPACLGRKELTLGQQARGRARADATGRLTRHRGVGGVSRPIGFTLLYSEIANLRDVARHLRKDLLPRHLHSIEGQQFRSHKRVLARTRALIAGLRTRGPGPTKPIVHYLIV